MMVLINGERRELPSGATVGSVLELLARESDSPAVASRGVAVAVDSEVVPRSRWSETPLTEGAQIEVLAAIQGGSAQ